MICCDCGLVVFPVPHVHVRLRLVGRGLLVFLFLEADEHARAVRAPDAASANSLSDIPGREAGRVRGIECRELRIGGVDVSPCEQHVLFLDLALRLLAAQRREVRAFGAPGQRVVVGRRGVEHLLIAGGERSSRTRRCRASAGRARCRPSACRRRRTRRRRRCRCTAARRSRDSSSAGRCPARLGRGRCAGAPRPPPRPAGALPAAAAGVGLCGRSSSHSPSGENAKLSTAG